MTDDLRFSIVTPSYQQAAFLRQTIESVLSQPVRNLEYGVVDGASKDGSVEIIREYEGKLSWWVSEPDHGQAEAINKGFQRVSGDIVAWINSDDYYQPGAFETVAQYFQTHPETGMVFGDVLAVDENSQPINLMRYGNWSLKELMRFEIIGQPAVFFRKTLLDQSGLLDSHLHCLLDHHLWIRMAARTRMDYIPQVLACARYHSGAKNVARPAAFAEEADKLMLWMQNEPILTDLWQRDQKQIRAGGLRLRAFYLAEGEEWGNAFKTYLRCFSLNPLYLRRDWRRFLYVMLNLLGIQGLIRLAQGLRRQKRSRNLNSMRAK